MKEYTADLHVHTLLSPCAEIEMTPHNIIMKAVEQSIDIVAITDHNAGDNIQAAIQAAAESGVVVIPGMEVETREEIHVVALFGKMREYRKFELFVESRRGAGLNVPEKFGPQYVVDADDEFIREKTEMLLAPINSGINEVVKKIHEYGGIAIAAHIDRPAYGILSVLGFIPQDLKLDAVEISSRVKESDVGKKFKSVHYPFLISSDAHFMDAFITGRKTRFILERPSFEELVMALRNEQGRKVLTFCQGSD